MIIAFIASSLMLIDTWQTKIILGYSDEAEANPIIRYLYRKGGMRGVLIFKLPLALMPFLSGTAGAILLLILYTWVVSHNGYYLRQVAKMPDND